MSSSPEPKGPMDDLEAAAIIAERKLDREYDEARAQGDEEGEKRALAGYARMADILDELLALLRF